VMVACGVMRGVLQRRLSRLATLSADTPGESTPITATPASR